VTVPFSTLNLVGEIMKLSRVLSDLLGLIDATSNAGNWAVALRLCGGGTLA
jgi:hypothetical protein